MPANQTEIEKRLWASSDELRANSKLKSPKYSAPVLKLIFLRYTDKKFSEASWMSGTVARRKRVSDKASQYCIHAHRAIKI